MKKKPLIELAIGSAFIGIVGLLILSVFLYEIMSRGIYLIVLGLLALPIGILALICGIKSIQDINKSKGEKGGKGFAIAGILMAIIIIAFLVWVFTALSSSTVY
jgi:hypothetical protein